MASCRRGKGFASSASAAFEGRSGEQGSPMRCAIWEVPFPYLLSRSPQRSTQQPGRKPHFDSDQNPDLVLPDLRRKPVHPLPPHRRAPAVAHAEPPAVQGADNFSLLDPAMAQRATGMRAAIRQGDDPQTPQILCLATLALGSEEGGTELNRPLPLSRTSHSALDRVVEGAYTEDLQRADSPGQAGTAIRLRADLEVKMVFDRGEVRGVAGLAGVAQECVLLHRLVSEYRDRFHVSVEGIIMLTVDREGHAKLAAVVNSVMNEDDLAVGDSEGGRADGGREVPALVGFRGAVGILANHSERVADTVAPDDVPLQRPGDAVEHRFPLSLSHQGKLFGVC